MVERMLKCMGGLFHKPICSSEIDVIGGMFENVNDRRNNAVLFMVRACTKMSAEDPKEKANVIVRMIVRKHIGITIKLKLSKHSSLRGVSSHSGPRREREARTLAAPVVAASASESPQSLTYSTYLLTELINWGAKQCKVAKYAYSGSVFIRTHIMK